MREGKNFLIVIFEINEYEFSITSNREILIYDLKKDVNRERERELSFDK